MRVPFNRPYVTGRELGYIDEAIANHHLSGDGPFTKKCHAWLQEHTGCQNALLTHSCTAALRTVWLVPAALGKGRLVWSERAVNLVGRDVDEELAVTCVRSHVPQASAF